MPKTMIKARTIWKAIGTLHWADDPEAQNLEKTRSKTQHTSRIAGLNVQREINPLHKTIVSESLTPAVNMTAHVTGFNKFSTRTSTGKNCTHDNMIPNVMRLPSIIIKLPLLAAGEHSA
jgi:hypothetical protein